MSEEITDGYHVRRREFLNEDPELPAFIIAVVEDTRNIPDDDPEQSWNHGYIVLDLADCKRRIGFYFDMRNREERANSLRKITLIAEVVNAVRDAIALEVTSRNARPAKVAPAKTESPTTIPKVVATTRTGPAKPASVFTSHFVTLGL